MSKRYFLIPANSEPLPGKGKSLQGVDSHSVEELIKIDSKYGLFIKKCNCEQYIRQKQSKNKERVLSNRIEKWFKTKKEAFAHIPLELKRTLLFIFLLIVVLIALTIFCNQEAIVKCAFIAFVPSVFLGPCKYFARDKIYGAVIVLLIAAGTGFLFGDLYFWLANRYPSPIKVLNRDNIGNLLTILSLFFSFVGYFNDLLFAFEVDVCIQDEKEQ